MSDKKHTKDSRQRILLTALELFANQGFANTSTREIALKANVNLSSIKYYFGDKVGLYKATYQEPMNCPRNDISLFTNKLTIDEALDGLFLGFLAPLKENEHVKLCVKLHMRETLDSTGLWDSAIENELKPHHEAFANVLRKELGDTPSDEDVHRLTFSIMSFGIFLFVGQDIIGIIQPSLLNSYKAIDTWRNRFVLYAKAMIETEKMIGKTKK